MKRNVEYNLTEELCVLTKKQWESNLERINQISKCNGDSAYPNCSEDELLELDGMFMSMSLACKKLLEKNIILNKEEKPKSFISEEEMQEYQRKMKRKQKDFEDKITQNLPVEIKFDGDVLAVHTPYVFKRGNGGDYSHVNFLVADMVNIALAKWLEENEKESLEFNKIAKKYTIILLRMTSNFTIKSICDNDNIEAGRIINTIFNSYLYMSDSALHLDYVIKYEQCFDESKEGTYFIVMDTETYESNPKKYIDYV